MAVTVDDERNEIVADRTVRRSGGSYVVSLPPEILNAADIGCDEAVEVCREHGSDGEIQIRRKDGEGAE